MKMSFKKEDIWSLWVSYTVDPIYVTTDFVSSRERKVWANFSWKTLSESFDWILFGKVASVEKLGEVDHHRWSVFKNGEMKWKRRKKASVRVYVRIQNLD
jgi:hypothetical protein